MCVWFVGLCSLLINYGLVHRSIFYPTLQILLNNMAPLRAGQTTAPLAGLGIGRDRPRELRPGENLDVVVEHVLQELDWHYLAVRR